MSNWFSRAFGFASNGGLLVTSVISSSDAFNAGFRQNAATGAVVISPASGVSIPFVLDQNAVQVTAPADTSEDTLYTKVIPANSIGPNGSIRFTWYGSHTSNANAKTWRLKIGSNVIRALADTTSVAFSDQFTLLNRNSLSSQVAINSSAGAAFSTSSANALSTYAIDFSVDQTMTITGQKASAPDTMTFEAVLIEIMYGA